MLASTGGADLRFPLGDPLRSLERGVSGAALRGPTLVSLGTGAIPTGLVLHGVLLVVQAILGIIGASLRQG